jgi:ubiquinone/menaquinone biosynthesis C-methylase UbiE
MTDKSQLVKAVFENTSVYLTFDYNIRIRKETVEAFTKGKTFQSILDIPCGTGAMSVPLLAQSKKLTLVDISSNMLEVATKSIPQNEKEKVEIIHNDFFKISLPEKSYDLVICLGLMAHVNSPEQLIQKISSLVAPGGLLIIQNTDSSHFYSYLIRLYLGMKQLIKKQPYRLNKVDSQLLENGLKQNGFELQHQFRYNQSFLGLSNLFSNDKKYSLTRWFFGDVQNNKHAAWGSDYTYLFKKI